MLRTKQAQGPELAEGQLTADRADASHQDYENASVAINARLRQRSLSSFSLMMCVQLAIAALLLSGCTGITQVRGFYAGELSPGDVREIRRLVARPPHFGHTVIALHATGRDRVRVEIREYQESGCDGVIQYVVRRRGTWYIDEHSAPQWITERIVVTS